MQTNSDTNSVSAAMVAALVTRKPPAVNESPSHNTMRAYLDKLRDLVPHCPKNRNVSKLELIQHVIDYINDLQETLQSSSDRDSPPSSPTGPISFTEAFSHLSFNEDGSLRGIKASPSSDECIHGYSQQAAAAATAYTSDGASDYDSRGSSPINNSDADCSSDEFSPTHFPHPFYTNSLALQVALPTPSFSGPPVVAAAATNEPRRFFRKGYGLPAHHSG